MPDFLDVIYCTWAEALGPENVKALDASLERQLTDQEKAEREVAAQEAKRATWGSSAKAQADAAALMSMAGGEG